MEDKRLISEERGKKVAEENGIKFFETSAKENINIELAFNTVNIAIKTLIWYSSMSPTRILAR